MQLEKCWDQGWLRYHLVQDQERLKEYNQLFTQIVLMKEGSAAGLVDESSILSSAVKELEQGIKQMVGTKPSIDAEVKLDGFIWLATFEQIEAALSDERMASRATELQNPVPEQDIRVSMDEIEALKKRQKSTDGYVLESFLFRGKKGLLLLANSESGLLYAAFHLLRLVQMEQSLDGLKIVESPKNQLRMLNHWDNMDGSIERGYAGQSIFFERNRFVADKGRIKDYARLLSSVGINAITINNVNVHAVETKLITSEYLAEVGQVASIFRRYGVQLFLSINYASPIQLGDLDTADPLDERVKLWWKEKIKEVYDVIPDFGGVLVKADSEHRPGPFTYNRTHADGANMLAEALRPYGGIVLWRCFVYNCMQDWRDRRTDRARAAYDHFQPLDGQFADNVVLQIKNGPMDFQVREPVSPLFGSMPNTNQILEFQITQEYTGQQKHVCYLLPQWKEILGFDTYAKGKGTLVQDIMSGDTYGYRYSGITAVANVGADSNWTGHTLAQANLYGYGRLIWNTTLSSETIADEWIRLTLTADKYAVQLIKQMLLDSWSIYEQYTSPLGVGWMVNPEHHYGPNVDGYEYSVWGTYHYADHQGVGVNRTKKNGTGYTEQYHTENAQLFEALGSCPDELLLFFHHVSYTHVLHSGKTVIQHIYDTHFEGAECAHQLLVQWLTLEDKIEPVIFEHVKGRLIEQSEHAKEWCDRINSYFYRKSGIADTQNRLIY
ncbi:alpha-glucuronidase family glycosyl hydrolase [Bacillus horti]|uniref:Xylan alpha-1,2-glucuronidase n=1 Tax=Caldalkalibacillus horti TaxID=77523 RepID=A0ABT9W2K0_9BACI|nr:alpha-glucuronidase family glycosyl hydrolase [Bacillus horti]MDQ0167463.1 alpha-glucuronidase [Bacillus horti]